MVPLVPRNARSQLSKGEAINALSGCLTLLKPVGMTEDLATEWLAVAAMEVLHLERGVFLAGCARARQECSHHGQIIPTILKGAEDAGKPDPFSRFSGEWEAAAKLSAEQPKLPCQDKPNGLSEYIASQIAKQ